MLIEEEGLRYGTIVRIAYWLGVSPSTIRRDIEALLIAGDPTVTAAAAVTRQRAPGKRRAMSHAQADNRIRRRQSVETSRKRAQQ
ncbi:MAG: hypothetical protein KC438_05740 [Thermomicrobiales bacterium]|nr:hypothetical protein [Thermomicrobiales bacterium]MCO5222774.1 hypothetical protein [Thermomicrobiales bacterium]